MKILGYVNKNSGPGFHRIMMPLLMMRDVDVFVTNDLPFKYLEQGVDIFMYNRTMPPEAMPEIFALQKKHGFKICVDVDDYWHLDEHHILYKHYEDIGFASQQIAHLDTADIVLTTHSRLAAEIYQYNANVHVVPNAIPKQGQFDIERQPHHLTRLFWQGSATHEQDIAILQQAIGGGLRFIASKIKMVMAGYELETDNEDIWYRMGGLYTAGFKHQYKIIPGVAITEYYANYAHADICLVPLVKSRFNSFKSNLKVLEAANLGLPVIASQVDPYLDMPVLYCKSGNDWVKHITRLVESKKRRKEAGQELAEFCAKHFDFHKINNMRKQIFEYATKTIV